MLLKYKTCYATHKNDVGKISTPSRIRLKPNAQLMTQRPSKVPIHYRDKLNALVKELEKYSIIKQIGSFPQDKPVYGITYLNPLIIIPKGDTIKCVLDARHLNSNTISLHHTILELLFPVFYIVHITYKTFFKINLRIKIYNTQISKYITHKYIQIKIQLFNTQIYNK